MITNKMPLISIIIPTYNRGRTICYCLDSILIQRFWSVEIIVVDDCSADDTINMVRNYKDPRIQYVIQPANLGAQAARNRGVRAASGDWIAFQDSDDEWMPEKLEIQVEALRKCDFDPMTVVHTDCWRYDPATGEKKLWNLPPVHGDSIYKQMLASPGPMFQGILTSKLALEKIGFLDEGVPSYQEWDTAIRLAKYCRFVHLQQPLFVYHLHQGETISKNKRRDFEGYQYIVDKFRDEIVSHCGKDVYNRHLTANACRAMNWGYFEEARAVLDKCMGTSPGILLLKLLSRLESGPAPYEILTRWGILPDRLHKA